MGYNMDCKERTENIALNKSTRTAEVVEAFQALKHIG